MGKQFAAARREALAEPVTFDCTRTVEVPANGDEPARTDVKVDTFTCRGQLSTLMLSEFSHQSNIDVASAEGTALVAQFFRSVFGDPDEYGRFFRYSQTYLDDDVIVQIIGYLVEEFTGRPTKQPSPSPAQPSTTGPTSTAAGSPPAGQVLRMPAPAEQPEEPFPTRSQEYQAQDLRRLEDTVAGWDYSGSRPARSATGSTSS